MSKFITACKGRWVINPDQIQSIHVSADGTKAHIYFTGGDKILEGEADISDLLNKLI